MDTSKLAIQTQVAENAYERAVEGLQRVAERVQRTVAATIRGLATERGEHPNLPYARVNASGASLQGSSAEYEQAVATYIAARDHLAALRDIGGQVVA